MTPRQAVRESFDAQAQGPVAERALAASVRGARNLARRAARTRRGAAALCNAEGPGRSARQSFRASSARPPCCFNLPTAATRPRRRSRPTCASRWPASSHACASPSVFGTRAPSYAEAVYALPLADDAAVDRLLMQVGERVIEGEIHERQRAERIYGEARAAGQRASLVRQTSANLFTTAVANIAPGETIDITIEYLQTARYDAGEFSLRVPLTLTPRYGLPDTPEGVSALELGGATRDGRERLCNGGRRPPSGTTKRRAQHPVARSVRPRGARARHATRVARQPQPRAERGSRARGGMDGAPQRRSR